MMTGERSFILILIINSLISLLCLLWGVVLLPMKKKKKPYGRAKYVILSIVMLLCPVVGPAFFVTGYLLFLTVFHQKVDLSDVIFSKEKRASNNREEDESKFNLVPLEEAIAVSDKNSLRNLMMSIIKGDVQKSLATISLALNSEDSETAHYAASVLRDELNDFRENVQRMYSEISKSDTKQHEYCLMLLKYMNEVLVQKVFVPMEQEYFVYIMEKTGEILYRLDKNNITSKMYEAICLRLLEIKDYDLTGRWCDRAFDAHPSELSSYTCKLKLYFNMQEKEKFFRTMQELKGSNVVIDNETLELIRIFM